MRFYQTVCLLIWLGIAPSQLSFAHDLSLLSGFYRSDKLENGPESTEISFGARYALRPAKDQSQWFVRGEVASLSYSGPNAPEGATNFLLGGGKLYYIKKMASDIRSYLAWEASFLSRKDQAGGGSELESSGLLYAGHAGFRFDMNKGFYFEIDAQLFESALIATETTRDATATPAVESKRKRMEVYLESFSGVEDLRFGLGYVF